MDSYNRNFANQPLVIEISPGQKDFSEHKKARKFFLIITILGILISLVPILVFLFNTLVGSSRSFAISKPLYAVFGGMGAVILFIILIVLIKKPARKVSQEIIPEKSRTGAYITMLFFLILVLFVITGFILFKILLISSDNYNQETDLALTGMDYDRESSLENINLEEELDNINIYSVKPEKEVEKEERKEIFLNEELLKELPTSANIRIVFYSEEDGRKFIDNEYILKGDTQKTEPDLEIFIKTKYVQAIKEDFCSGLKKVNEEGGISYKLNENSIFLMSRYSEFFKYKNCL